MPGCCAADCRAIEELLLAGVEPITKLREAAHTSAVTVTRLSTHLGYAGYPVLRAALTMEVGRGREAGLAIDTGVAVTPTDTPKKVLSVLASNQANALGTAPSMIERDRPGAPAWNALAAMDLTAVIAVADAERIHIHVAWSDAVPARDL